MPIEQVRIYLLIEDDAESVDELLQIAKSPEGWRHLVHEYKHSITSPFELDEHFPVQDKMPDEFIADGYQLNQSPYFIRISPDKTSAIFGEYV